MKTRTNQEIIDNAYKAGVISEKDILLLKRRLNNKSFGDVRMPNEIKVSDEQKEKGLKWLRNLYVGGKKYHCNDFGSGIVFQSYNLTDLNNQVEKLKNE